MIFADKGGEQQLNPLDTVLPPVTVEAVRSEPEEERVKVTLSVPEALMARRVLVAAFNELGMLVGIYDCTEADLAAAAEGSLALTLPNTASIKVFLLDEGMNPIYPSVKAN